MLKLLTLSNTTDLIYDYCPTPSHSHLLVLLASYYLLLPTLLRLHEHSLEANAWVYETNWIQTRWVMRRMLNKDMYYKFSQFFSLDKLWKIYGHAQTHCFTHLQKWLSLDNLGPTCYFTKILKVYGIQCDLGCWCSNFYNPNVLYMSVHIRVCTSKGFTICCIKSHA